MHTSYFARMNSNSFKGRDLNQVSIARSCKYYSGRKYAPLFPTWEMIKIEDEEVYRMMYERDVLSKLDPLVVYEALGEDAILLCHESEKQINDGRTFCHRHMVARWLENELWLQYDIDINVNELHDIKAELKKSLKKK